MNKTPMKVLGTIGTVLALCGFIVACSEPPPQPEEKQAAPVAAKPTEGESLESAKPEADPAVKPLIVWIEAEPEEGKAPLEVKFAARLKGGTPPYKLQWAFGDESEPTSKANPVHTYSEPGTYFVEITAEDSGGDEDDDDMEIAVE